MSYCSLLVQDDESHAVLCQEEMVSVTHVILLAWVFSFFWWVKKAPEFKICIGEKQRLAKRNAQFWNDSRGKSGLYIKCLQIKFDWHSTGSEAEAGPEGGALNTAVFLDKHSGAWGGFGADRRACSSLSGPPGEADWINSSLRGSCSLRGHKGNVGWRERNGGALSRSHRTAACLYTRLLLHKYCTAEMTPAV